MRRTLRDTALAVLVSASLALSPALGPMSAYAENEPASEELATQLGPIDDEASNATPTAYIDENGTLLPGDEWADEQAEEASNATDSADGSFDGEDLLEGNETGEAAAEEVVASNETQELDLWDNETEIQDENATNVEGNETTIVTADDKTSEVTLSVRAHVGGKWGPWSTGASTATFGKAGKRLDAFAAKLSLPAGVAGGITYKAYVQGVGWQDPRSDGAKAGRAGKKKRIEALKFSLTGGVAGSYDIWYRVYVDGTWMGWAKNGESAGTTGFGKRIEMVELALTKSKAAAPGTTSKAYRDAGLSAQAHVQKLGWMNKKTGYKVKIGTTGKSQRMEALKIDRPALDLSGDIVYRAHVQNMGWMPSVKNGEVAGTSNKGYRIEALRVKLTGELAQKYDVWYRVHVSNVGWQAWAKNWQKAGTQGLSMRVESIQIALVAKGKGAPSAKGQKSKTAFMKLAKLSYDAYEKNNWTGWVSSGKKAGVTGKSRVMTGMRAKVTSPYAKGSIKYRAHVSGTGWTGWTANGSVSGDMSHRIEAIRLKLKGEVAKYCDVWYRAYVQNAGWLGWAKNGQSAGSTGASKAIEAYQVKIVPKGTSAPGSTQNHLVGASFFRGSNSKSKQSTSADGSMFHNVPWAGQPNNYYCGPTAGYMILAKLGATKSASGASLSIGNVADAMGTSTLGYTSFNDRAFAHGLNQWLGEYIYTTISTPSYSEIRTKVIESFENGYPVAVDAHERAGGTHYNGHSDGTYSHILVIDGYNPKTDAVYFADPGAGVLWSGASSKFWYPSLKTFTETYLSYYPWRDGIGMMAAR